MEMFLQQVLNGLFLGSIYALLALGYTMVYGIIKLINFAHGEVYMIGAFFGLYLIEEWQANFFIALIGAMIFCALLGMLIEFLAYRPLRHSPRITVLITAIGISYLLQNVMIYFFTSATRPFPQEVLPKKEWAFAGVQLTSIQLTILLTAIFLMIALQVIVKYTKMGRAMRAVSVDEKAAQLMGINVNRTISFTFALGSALAGAAGVLIGLYYNSVDPMMGAMPGIKAFVAAVFGGIGIIPGAALGGVTIGLLETGVVATSLSPFKDAVVYLILIVILLVKPAGLLGKNRKEKV
ncbi:branched-chain amino acid ABC transporter permease [Enterococcus timonensis]|uniref:branched-chain amino acid ABC transporter permease n=1 Tax=Enterococcus timonensis TaxID=1852364 RepID=UPI000B1A4D52|nr:branched-chain amino acid ABC transporter permease [Enterococcus timonensis]